MFTHLLAAAAPSTFTWSPAVGMVMIACNVLAFVIAKANIEHQNEGFDMPNNKFYGGMSHASVVGSQCLGHILGMGTILGLASRGVL
ncbi:Photosystem I reaction center subunit PsaK precursor [Prochlorococcus marinus str. MIT 1342]|jgi:photosystem I subunit 10|uniref:Photosystem I PsaK protein (Subunit X) n=2 Tax=Prochlorococcus marinus TaxID=1219 RepID=Q7V7Q1_PROMM|nr:MULTISPECIES: photosystem I reaction center subunit PsaK [Prochlorococcus]MCH2565387.1 photosystem I reaction center subunit PsaK [Prochlorococcus sp. ALOHA_A2.0_51]MEC7382595.1 photosystem I reaction center subunit PsaK [Cyanobacteriota bacterium]RPG00290.1 MAG: photosystem I reaction center subunit PsaK [Prochlorococcus sp. TMED223]RZO51868.1 MAG: photosystem I reaction center subunit PsaK [Prochlorococcus sp. MED-G132]HJN33624.1 photosystem I reaction center subunit PsaK [Prochlorococcus|tara:strand:+ start:440 stop:700 length:261 start_codon:yes stop_codon:yes gene_type:complete